MKIFGYNLVRWRIKAFDARVFYASKIVPTR
jgi:hypothetical protein